MKPEEQIGLLLVERRWTLAVAESCTGGLIGHRITSVAGSSRYFLGGIIAYSNDVKVKELGVDPKVLEQEGAVSGPVADQMAGGVMARFGADVGLGVTGIAGPGGEGDMKPAGLVFGALACGAERIIQQFNFDGDRSSVKLSSSQSVLEMLVEYLKNKE